MNVKNKRIEKMCSFYVSDWHLATMILPYISNQIAKNTKIITIFENNIKQNIETLIEKLNIKNKEKILSISWENINSTKYEEIEKKLKQEINAKGKNIVLINGNINYIEKNNYNVEKWFEKNKISSLKIINFFEMTEFNNNIVKILDAHDKVFNTSGEKEINEVFEGYKKEEII